LKNGGLAIAGALILLLHLAALPAAVTNLKYFSATLRHAQCCLKFLNVLPPQPATRATLCPDDAKVRRMANLLDAAGVLEYPLLKSTRLADFRVMASNAAAPCGSMEASRLAGSNLVLSGWALSPSRTRAADCVVFTREGDGLEPEIFAVMDRHVARFDLARKFSDAKYLLSGWQTTRELAQLPKGALIIKAWAFDANTDTLSPLENGIYLDNK
jgi:hypothetical protein